MGSVESKNTATEDSNCLTSIVAAIARLGMPAQSTPTSSASWLSWNGPQWTAVAPFMSPDSSAPPGATAVATSKVCGGEAEAAARMRSERVADPAAIVRRLFPG